MKLGCLGGNDPNNPHHSKMQKRRKDLERMKECQRQSKAAEDRIAQVKEERAKIKEETAKIKEEKTKQIKDFKDVHELFAKHCHRTMDPSSPEYAKAMALVESFDVTAPNAKESDPGAPEKQAEEPTTEEATAEEEEQKAPECRQQMPRTVAKQRWLVTKRNRSHQRSG